MVTQDDIRTICLKLPGSIEGTDRFGFSVSVKGKLKGYVWTWLERKDPKKARVVNEGVVAIVVPNEIAKFALIESEPEKYFTEPHYNGFNAVLVRLDKVTIEDLEDLLLEAWRCKVPSANHEK